MTTTLQNGTKIPDKYSRDWYADLSNNWNLLDSLIGQVASGTFQHDVIPSTTGTYKLGSSTNVWDAVYGNTYYLGTTPFGDIVTHNASEFATTEDLDNCVQQIGTNADNISGLQTAVASKAADNSVVHLAGAETITGDKTFTGAVATHNITPETDGAYSLGSSSYQWAKIYGKEYYYNGTQWGLDKANTWTGNNIFNKNISPVSVTSVTDTTLAFNGLNNTIFLNTRGSSNIKSYGSFLYVGYGNTSSPDRYGQIRLLRSTDKRDDTNDGFVPDTSFSMWRVAPHYLIMDAMEAVRVTNDGTENSLKPITTNATDLGTSSNKWKSLNGINPGALSLPANSYVAIDTTNFNKSGGLNTYTPPSNGWVGIQAASVSYNASYYVFIGRFTDGTTANPSYWSQGQVSPLMANFDGYIGQVFIPVIGGKLYHIRINGDFSTGGSIKAYFFPCLGNV